MQLALFNLVTAMQGMSHAETIRQSFDLIRAAEAVGFDIAWFAEHHFSNYSISCSPLMMAAQAAARVPRIKVGPAVLVLPFYEPLRLLEEIALADHLAGGRLVLGYGTGYQPYEFRRFGVTIGDRNAIAAEAWHIIETGLANGQIEFRGQHFDIPLTSIAIEPLRRRIDEIFLVSSDPKLIRHGAVRGHIPLVTPGWQRLDSLLPARQIIDESFALEGLGRPGMGVQRYVHVTHSKSDARKAAEAVRSIARMATNMRKPEPEKEGAYLRRPSFDGEPPISTFEANAIIGSPEECSVRLLAEAKMFGISHLSCFMHLADMPFENARKSLELFGREVIPYLRKHESIQA